jgi:1-acyl-sn-glycerol-3-phosphate acyltransferase
MKQGTTTEHKKTDAAGGKSLRIRLNRLIWRAYVFGPGSLVVWVEKAIPNRGYGWRLFSASTKLMHRLVGARIEVRGLERLARDNLYLFTPNHRSHMDNTAVIEAIPGVTFAAKRELFDEPVLGKTLRALEIIPIDRQNPERAKQALKDAAVKLGERLSVVIFPEGTRAPRGQMLPFKGGAFIFAIQLQVPIVPVAIHNTAEVMPARKYLTIRGGRIVVELLTPIPTVGLTIEDYPKLREQVRAVLSNALRPEDGGCADRSDLGFAPPTASERTGSSVEAQPMLESAQT